MCRSGRQGVVPVTLGIFVDTRRIVRRRKRRLMNLRKVPRPGGIADLRISPRYRNARVRRTFPGDVHLQWSPRQSAGAAGRQATDRSNADRQYARSWNHSVGWRQLDELNRLDDPLLVRRPRLLLVHDHANGRPGDGSHRWARPTQERYPVRGSAFRLDGVDAETFLRELQDGTVSAIAKEASASEPLPLPPPRTAAISYVLAVGLVVIAAIGTLHVANTLSQRRSDAREIHRSIVVAARTIAPDGVSRASMAEGGPQRRPLIRSATLAARE